MPGTIFPGDPYPTGIGMKRGSEELLSHSPLVTNGTGMSPTQADVNNDAKKVKLDQNQVGKPSRVIHIRGVPLDTTEGEIVNIGLPFGRMTNLVLAKKKNQALLEMADVNSAQTMVNYYNERHPQIRGRTCYVQFSNHEQLKTESSAQSFKISALLEDCESQMEMHGSRRPHIPSDPFQSMFERPVPRVKYGSPRQNGRPERGQNANAQAALQAAQNLMGSMDDPKTVLRVIIEHMLYPVTIDVLKQIFSRYGQVLKIVTFSKNNTFQALIQFSDAIAAQTAKVSLNGQNIYNGCCTLRIDFSKLTALNVKYNNDKSRDYTNPTLPSGDGSPMALDPSALALGDSSKFKNIGLGPVSMMTSSPFHVPSFGATAPGSLAAAGAAAAAAYGAHSAAGGPGATPLYTTESPTNHLHHHHHQPASTQLLTTAGFGALQAATAMPFGIAGLPAATPLGATGLRLPGHHATGTVLLVSNLNEETVTPDALFTLFGVYGDVIRVKIMFNKKDNALVQFNDPTQAQLALTHLDKIKVWGKPLKVAPSKHAVVQMPKEGQPDAGLTKDFSNSALHRFKKPNSKNHHNIFPPSATLHLSNIPPTTEEDQLKDLFTEHGTVVAFKFFQKDRKMALIQMSTVEEAVHALMALHNIELGNASHLRVSFTKSVI